MSDDESTEASDNDWEFIEAIEEEREVQRRAVSFKRHRRHVEDRRSPHCATALPPGTGPPRLPGGIEPTGHR
jgi:hypothetical protein